MTSQQPPSIGKRALDAIAICEGVKGIAAIASRVEPHRKADATSAYFVIAYLAISVPIIAVGFAAEAWGLTTAGVVFAAVIGVVSIGSLIGLLSRPKDAI